MALFRIVALCFALSLTFLRGAHAEAKPKLPDGGLHLGVGSTASFGVDYLYGRDHYFGWRVHALGVFGKDQGVRMLGAEAHYRYEPWDSFLGVEPSLSLREVRSYKRFLFEDEYSRDFVEAKYRLSVLSAGYGFVLNWLLRDDDVIYSKIAYHIPIFWNKSFASNLGLCSIFRQRDVLESLSYKTEKASFYRKSEVLSGFNAWSIVLIGWLRYI